MEKEKAAFDQAPDRAQMRKNVINMAWPAVLESFFVSFAGLVDSLMVSSLGSVAVAAVGLTTQPKFIGLALFFALNMAVSALVARRFGEQNRRKANEILATALGIVLVLGLVIGIGMAAGADVLMRLCASTPETHPYAVTYFRIIMGGMIFNCLQMGINAAQRGAGNTKITMRTNVVSNAINILFNWLLIGGHLGFPALGITGAALATVLGTVVACVMSILSICRKDTFVSLPYILAERVKPTFEALKNLVHVGYGVFLEQILMRIGFLATALMAAAQGNDAMAAHQVGMNLLGLSFSFGDGLQTTAIALSGRSLGMGRPDLAKGYGDICRRYGTLISGCLALVYLLGGRFLFGLFFREEHIVEIGVRISYVIIAVLFFQITQVIYMGCLRAAGDTLYTAVVSMVCVTLIRTAGSYFFGYTMGLGIIGIWFGILSDQLGRFLFSRARFRKGEWTKIRI